MTNLETYQFPCRSDNYGVLVHDPATGLTASIDAPDAAAVEQALDHTGWRLTHIFTTHHHADHTGGNVVLKATHECEIIGPRDEAQKIPGLDRPVGGGETFRFGDFDVSVLATPGHTLGHISYHIPAAKLAFVGDTMFAMGCGRVFEGDAKMMWASLAKLRGLPKDTVVFCGHEYTLSNAQFARTIEPDNKALEVRAKEVEALRKDKKPTLPTTIEAELETNPFLRACEPELKAAIGMSDDEDWQVFAEVRTRKDNA
ncbi:Hydroxyacylglutathione hydrolase [Candidatus Filomicrobium marinum]|uniref:Hydroxyacylglutathione hydrolase n=2 Tax=Filomicrobium TaxID=119044 RepID=A0A0D6JGB7_9HYPH|nr:MULTISPECIES: hydroxyacylglutathione hydrolase [Filomicrobium]MCV0370065.1 hydroxyacylglutathione hydrolase [Filomicrobium sp.]CFX27060.1 Hydroxyacylglutathione hydrolase [Candidatus Filomicrobium marinum]CPR19511.1 Hydroxyacylglutathione hydrolase [Candidatus Filomicrobium marinum]SDO05684.1 hydroxyacylglutathione hydrolase [Filomicrobium insigne]